MTADLFPGDAPKTVNNFVFLARDGFYDGVIFHRVIPGFMIQGGDPTGTGTRRPRLQVRRRARASGPYTRGTLAMANAGPNTNGSQFFVMHADYALPPSYTIFGKLTAGEEVVDAIATAPRAPRTDRTSPSRSPRSGSTRPERARRRRLRAGDRLGDRSCAFAAGSRVHVWQDRTHRHVRTLDKDAAEPELVRGLERLDVLQERLYATKGGALLIVLAGYGHERQGRDGSSTS